MNKKIFLTTLFLTLGFSCFGRLHEEVITKIAFNYNFNSGDEVLEPTYLNNGNELKKLDHFIKYNLTELKTNSAHFSIISHIKIEHKDDLQSINRASILASVLRAYLKMKYGLTNNNFSFYISCSGKDYDKVTLEYKSYPLKEIDNKEIYYTKTPTYNNLLTTIMKYREIPYLSNNQKPDYQYFPISSQDTCIINQSFPKNEVTDSKNFSTVEENSESEKKNIVIVFSGNDKVKNMNDFSPIIGVSTNLLKIFGASPYQIEGNLPNLSLEYYFKKRYSLKLEGILSPLNRASLMKSEGTWRRTSSLSMEARFWPRKSEYYTGLYTGLFGFYGDYDVKDKINEIIGNTGDFYGAGVSLGYSLKICDWLSIEAGMSGSYIINRSSVYEIMDGRFYLNETSTKDGFYIHDVNLGIVLRYGLRRKK